MELIFPLVLDGATGTALQKRGLDPSISPEEWTLKNPQVIQSVQRSYIEGGSRVVYSPTFGANRVKLEAHGLYGMVGDYNRALAGIAREGTDGKAYVAGDIAPTGKFLYPMSETTFDDLVDIYTEQAKALDEAGVDLFVIETMMTLPEARAALLAVRSISKKPVFVTFTCDEKGKTLTGTDVCAALVVMQGMGADAFGLNCSQGPKEMLVQLERLHEYACIPLIAKPNAGMPQVANGKTFYDCTPEEFVSCTEQMANIGVMIFGGCCGTDETHIAALAEAVRHTKMVAPSPKYPDLLPCATEKRVCYLPADSGYSRVLPCDLSLEAELEDANVSGDVMIALKIDKAEDLDVFRDLQSMIEKPLLLQCEDAALLEEALRLYQGRAMYEGNLPEAALLPLVKRYGLIL